MKIPEKVIEIKNSLTEDEIREEIKNFNNSNPKDAYTYLLLARNYWAIDELQSAGRMYETGLNASGDASDASVRAILAEDGNAEEFYALHLCSSRAQERQKEFAAAYFHRCSCLTVLLIAMIPAISTI